ncbi:hypothetical protein LHT11_04585 [Acetobacter indonesiensis]|uniref:hypothetical protein n=1 Tax=Acetobacter TaxID=434 RepID=UPI001EF094AD|nr:MULTISPECIES: hypothetical protein [Acetobacter]MCG0994480.1 hypothetical protein [Acetobacter indonesiensis]MCG0998814.1 hypothetical protein [Acetobacter persici]
MTPRALSSAYLLAFWPLVLLALIVRLTFGGIASPAALIDDPLKTFAKLSILCDDQSASSDPDGQHHRSAAPDDDGFLLSEALDLLVVSIVFCLFVGLRVAGIRPAWMFTSIRGPPTPKRTSLCPQGPPA